MAKNNVINFMSNIDGDSWIHRLDPRTKVALLLVFSTLPLLFTDPLYVLVFILLSIPLWITAKIDFRSMAGPFLAVGIFLFMIFFMNIFRSAGELSNVDYYSQYSWYIQIGPLVITSHTLQRAVWLAARLAVPLTIGLLVIATTDPTYLAKGLRKLKLPTELVFMVLAGLRFIPIVVEQLFNLLDAQTVRGVTSGRGERFKLLVLPLFITSLRRTRTMGLACEAKGFGAHKWNDFIEAFHLGQSDKLMLAGLLLLTVLSLIVRYGLGMGSALVGSIK